MVRQTAVLRAAFRKDFHDFLIFFFRLFHFFFIAPYSLYPITPKMPWEQTIKTHVFPFMTNAPQCPKHYENKRWAFTATFTSFLSNNAFWLSIFSLWLSILSFCFSIFSFWDPTFSCSLWIFCIFFSLSSFRLSILSFCLRFLSAVFLSLSFVFWKRSL